MSYDRKIYLTFDIDWACDEIFEHTIQILEKYQVSATFFVTHDTPLLHRLRNNPDFELGLHPNFNSLLSSSNQAYDAEQVVCALKNIVPEATSVRSHSLAQSSHILDIFLKHGITHDVNLLIPAYSGIELTVFRHINGIVRVPFFWEDDVHCVAMSSGYEEDWHPQRFLSRKGLKVFDFHPIHVFLNTENLQRYEDSRPFHRQAQELLQFRYEEPEAGSGAFLIHLIKEAKRIGFQFGKIGELSG